MLKNASSTAFGLVRGTTIRSLSTKVASEPSKKDVDELFDDDKPQTRRNVNRVELLGGVAENPQVRTAKNGRVYSVFTLITNNQMRLSNGETVEQSERHNVTVFGRAAEFVERNVQKGTRVLVHGRLHYSGGSLQDDGIRTPRNTHIHAEMVQPIAKLFPIDSDSKRDDEF